jgi:hypothetical protein
MRMRKLFSWALIALGLMGPAQAAQNTVVMPTAGPQTMAQVMTILNAGLLTFGTNFSGTSAPAVGPSSAAMTYQWWLDTSTSPKVLRIYDGANWVSIGSLDTTAHSFAASVASVTLSILYSDINSATLATSANFSGNAASKLLTPNAVWSAAAPATLTYSSTVTPDFGASLNFGLTLTGATAQLANPSNAKAGQTGVFRIAQDGTGGRLLTYGTSFKWPTGTACTLSTGASKIDYIFFFAYSSTEILLNCVKDVR